MGSSDSSNRASKVMVLPNSLAPNGLQKRKFLHLKTFRGEEIYYCNHFHVRLPSFESSPNNLFTDYTPTTGQTFNGGEENASGLP